MKRVNTLLVPVLPGPQQVRFAVTSDPKRLNETFAMAVPCASEAQARVVVRVCI